MKKISLSILAALAIVVVVISAFTTMKGKQQKFPVTEYWVVALTKDVLNTSPCPSAIVINSASHQSIFFSPYTSQQALSNFDDDCDFIDANQICVSQYAKVYEVPHTILGCIGGDYVPD